MYTVGDQVVDITVGFHQTFNQQELVQFNAEEILQDPSINEMWLRSVQRDPSHFLGVKFSMQLSQQEEER